MIFNRLNSMKKLLVVLGFLTLFACSSNKKELVDPTELVKIQNQGRFTQLWKRSLDKAEEAYGYQLRPAFNKGRLYVATQSGRVLALDAVSGKEIWVTDLDVELSAGPGLGDDLLAVGSPEGQLFALDMETGQRRWNTQVTSEILSSPVIDRNVLVVRTQDGRVYGFSTDSGVRQWVFDTEIPNLTLRGNSRPVARAGRVYIGFDSGQVAALNIDDGSVLWQQNVVDNQGKTELDRIADIDGDIAVVATELYLSSAAGKTLSVATESGRILWAQDYGSVSGITVSRRSLFISDTDSKVRMMARADGSLEWTQEALLNRSLTKPVSLQGDLVVGDLEGYLHVLDGEDGTIKSRVRAGSNSFYSAPLVVVDVIYSYNKDGALVAHRYSESE